MVEIEKTLVLVKPDGVQRGLIGKIISRFEAVGLTIVGLKMVEADKETLDKHYPVDDPQFLKSLGETTLKNSRQLNIDVETVFKTTDPQQLGAKIHSWLVGFMQSSPIVAIVLAGPGAIAQVRKMRGQTLPSLAQPGTILGDLGNDSAVVANWQQRSVRNLLHASGNSEEAKFEVELWFNQSELYGYKTIDQRYMLDEIK